MFKKREKPVLKTMYRFSTQALFKCGKSKNYYDEYMTKEDAEKAREEALKLTKFGIENNGIVVLENLIFRGEDVSFIIIESIKEMH